MTRVNDSAGARTVRTSCAPIRIKELLRESRSLERLSAGLGESASPTAQEGAFGEGALAGVELIELSLKRVEGSELSSVGAPWDGRQNLD